MTLVIWLLRESRSFPRSKGVLQSAVLEYPEKEALGQVLRIGLRATGLAEEYIDRAPVAPAKFLQGSFGLGGVAVPSREYQGPAGLGKLTGSAGVQ